MTVPSPAVLPVTEAEFTALRASAIRCGRVTLGQFYLITDVAPRELWQKVTAGTASNTLQPASGSGSIAIPEGRVAFGSEGGAGVTSDASFLFTPAAGEDSATLATPTIFARAALDEEDTSKPVFIGIGLSPGDIVNDEGCVVGFGVQAADGEGPEVLGFVGAGAVVNENTGGLQGSVKLAVRDGGGSEADHIVTGLVIQPDADDTPPECAVGFRIVPTELGQPARLTGHVDEGAQNASLIIEPLGTGTLVIRNGAGQVLLTFGPTGLGLYGHAAAAQPAATAQLTPTVVGDFAGPAPTSIEVTARLNLIENAFNAFLGRIQSNGTVATPP